MLADAETLDDLAISFTLGSGIRIETPIIQTMPAALRNSQFRDFMGAIIGGSINTVNHLQTVPKWLNENGNLCFENNRINHFSPEHYFYLGWGWRSPAQKLIVRNPETGLTCIFQFDALRAKIASYISQLGKQTKIAIVETDKQKTTFNILVPMRELASVYKRFDGIF